MLRQGNVQSEVDTSERVVTVWSKGVGAEKDYTRWEQ